MLLSKLKHIGSGAGHKKAISENDYVVIICGHTVGESVAAYETAEELKSKYKHVKFFDMEYDNPESQVIRSIPEVQSLYKRPLTIFYKNGIVVKATSGVIGKDHFASILEEEFSSEVRQNSSRWWW